MVAFRKLFPALAGLTLLLGASSAFGQVTGGTGGVATQGSPVCAVNAGVPPLVRAEGYSELVGDIVITCTGGNPATPFLANFQLFLNTQVTSRLVTSSLLEAMLLIDDPGAQGPELCVSPDAGSNTAGFGGVASPACNAPTPAVPFQTGSYNGFLGQLGAGAQQYTSVLWTGVPVVPPGSNRTRTFRIVNIRANANGIGVSSTFLPNQILAFLSISPPGSLPLNIPQVTVAYVQQGVLFDARNCDNDGGIGGGINFDACVSTSPSQARPGGTLSNQEIGAFGQLRFREGFPTAFKPRIEIGQETAPVGTVFNTESGFVRSTLPGGPTPSNGVWVGRADTGTRLVARFMNMPANVRLFVGTRDSDVTGANAILVSGSDAAGAGGSVVPVPGGSDTFFTLTCDDDDDAASVPASEVSLTAGSGIAVWEVTNASIGSDTLLFPIGVGFIAATGTGTTSVGIGTGTVQGHFAPWYPVPSTVTGPIIPQQVTAFPIPRFAPTGDPVNIFRTAPCVSALLFPYVTNWAGFDTGIAIANTSTDPFSDPNDRIQGGTCTLNYYGRQANGNDPVRANETTNAAVASGETITLVLSTGGSLGLQGNPNFQGYIIATCNFLYAHGFAFITDGPIGQARVAEGYLALVLGGEDDSVLRGPSTAEVRGH